MKTNPEIINRTTEELLDIVSNVDDWLIDVRHKAKDELVKRGVGVERQELLETIVTKGERNKKKIKTNASYPTGYKIFMILFPFLAIIFPFSNGDSIIKLEAAGYFRKSKERFLFLLLGTAFWLVIIYFFSDEIRVLANAL